MVLITEYMDKPNKIKYYHTTLNATIWLPNFCQVRSIFILEQVFKTLQTISLRRLLFVYLMKHMR
jgi:hypothetical protein